MTVQGILRRFLVSTFVFIGATASAYAGGLTLAHPYREGSAAATWARTFSECLQKVTGIPVQVISGSKLGRPRDMAEAVSVGYVDMTVLPLRYLEDRLPKLHGLSLPGLVDSPHHIVALVRNPEFVSALNDITYSEEAMVLAVGWHYGALVGRDLTAGELFRKRIHVFDAGMANAMQKLGGTVVRVPNSELGQALSYGVIDGAIVGADMVRRTSEMGVIDSVHWSDDFTPFVTPVAIAMNRSSSYSFSIEANAIAGKCGYATQEFNDLALQEITEAVTLAVEHGNRRFSLSPDQRGEWQEAFDSVRRDELGSRDEIADLVRRVSRR